MLRNTSAAFRLHPFGFGLPVAVIAAALIYLIVAGPVSVRFGHPGPAAGRPQAVGQAPGSTDPPHAAQPGAQPISHIRAPGSGRPVSGYVTPGGGTGVATGASTATGTGRGQPSTGPGSPASPPSPSSPVPAGTPPATAPPGTNASCLDLGVLSVCL